MRVEIGAELLRWARERAEVEIMAATKERVKSFVLQLRRVGAGWEVTGVKNLIDGMKGAANVQR